MESRGKITGTTVARSSLQVVFGQVLRFLLQLSSLAVLARVLTPEDFGLFGMVIVVVNFLNLISNLGLVQATVQREEINHAEISQLFWLNLLFSGVLAAGLIYSAPLIATFYDRDELVAIVRVLGVLVFLQGASVQHNAMLQRAFKFKAIVMVESLAYFFGVLAAILTAWKGFGYWALVIQQVVYYSLTASGYFSMSRWVPGPLDFSVKVAPYLKYGLWLAASNMLNFTSRNADNAIIGKFHGGPELAFYQRAYSLLMLPINQLNGPLTKVMLSALSKYQSSGPQFRSAYRQALSTLVNIGAPVVCLCGLLSSEIILIVLGEQWVPSISYFVALLPAALIGATNTSTGWVYNALGHTAKRFRWSLLHASVFTVSVLVAAQFSMLTVCYTVSAVFVGMQLPAVIYCFRGTVLKLSDFLLPVSRAFLLSASSAIVAAGLYEYLFPASQMGLLTASVLKSLTFLVLFAGIDFGLPGKRAYLSYKYLVEKIL